MGHVAVDACCLINLLSAGKILPTPTSRAVSHGLDWVFHVPRHVVEESLYLLQPDEDDGTKLLRVPIDLDPYLRAGLLHFCDIDGEEETAMLVQLAARLDDGEAACLAIAQHRGWLLATDDRPATKLAGQLGVTVVTTGQIVQDWSHKTEATREQIAGVLLNIQRLARFVPRPSSPEYSWWMEKTSGKRE